jgi:hypothetical protein
MDHLTFAQLLGSYGEFVGAIAVIATLIYLSVQVRHSRSLLDENRRVGLSQVHQERSSSINNILDRATEKDLLSILTKTGLSAVNAGIETKWDQIDQLSEEDKHLLSLWYTQLLTHIDDVQYQDSLGLLDEQSLLDSEERHQLMLQHAMVARNLQLVVPVNLAERFKSALQ